MYFWIWNLSMKSCQIYILNYGNMSLCTCKSAHVWLRNYKQFGQDNSDTNLVLVMVMVKFLGFFHKLSYPCALLSSKISGFTNDGVNDWVNKEVLYLIIIYTIFPQMSNQGAHNFFGIFSWDTLSRKALRSFFP